MPTQELLLLRTKLDVPPPRAHTLARERLLALVPDAPETRLVLVCAPAGFGKTTFLASWCHALARQGAAVAWVALDKGDNEPARFWAYLYAAIGCAIKSADAPNGASWRTAPDAAEGALALTPLINTLAALDRDLVLVLDDYQAISAPAIHTEVAFLLDHLPTRVRIAIGSRADPPLPLARLRAREQLAELRAAQLRFTPAEVQAFFQRVSQLPLTAGEACAIGAYAEGWPAGVQLIALALQSDRSAQSAESVAGGQPALDHALAQLEASQPYLFAYLADDVFERQPPHLKAFLLQTAILDEICAPLCDAVLGVGSWELGVRESQPTSSQPLSSNSQDSYSHLILEALEHANLFIMPLDHQRRWYRYHQLFRAFLRARLAAEPPETLAELHRRAGTWFERQQLLPSAVEHTLAAGDLAHAAELIERGASAAIERGEYAALQRWLDRIPGSILAARPGLCLSAAWAALLAGQVERIEPPLMHAERAWQASGDQCMLGEVALLHAQLAWLRHDAEATIAAAQLALSALAEDAGSARASSLLALGAGQLLAGDLAAADTTLRAAYTQCQAHSQLALPGVLYSQGQLAQQRGLLSEAARKYSDAIQAMGERAGWERWAAAIGLGQLARERDELDQALETIQAALTAAEQAGVAVYLPHGYVALARSLAAQQSFAAADAALERAADVARRLGSPAQISQARAYRARLALARGDQAAAEHWRAEAEPKLAAPSCHRHEVEALTLARVLIAQGCAASSQAHDTVQSLLEQLHQAAEAQGRVGSQIECLALAALAAAAERRRDRALNQLRQALVLAAPAGYARLFLDEGPPMAALLRADLPLLSADSALRGYAQRLLASFPRQGEPAAHSTATYSIPRAPHAALVETLSDRELEVLQLIAGGASNQAIAARLMISLGTVKSHINHILGKLAAGNRTEAVARAREVGLFTEP